MESGDFDKKGENGENRQSLSYKSNDMVKGFSLKVAILTTMANYVLMMNMENICQSLGKNSDKMAKGPFKSADFDGNGEFGKNRPALAISQMRWQSGPL